MNLTYVSPHGEETVKRVWHQGADMIISDRNGWIRYNYNREQIAINHGGGEVDRKYINYLSSITASDGRRVNFTYETLRELRASGTGYMRLQEVSWNGRTIKINYGEFLELESISLINGEKWQIGRNTVNFPGGLKRSYDSKKGLVSLSPPINTSDFNTRKELDMDYSNGLTIKYRLSSHDYSKLVTGDSRNKRAHVTQTKMYNNFYCTKFYYYLTELKSRGNISGSVRSIDFFSDRECTNRVESHHYEYDNVSYSGIALKTTKKTVKRYYSDGIDTFVEAYQNDSYARPEKVIQSFSSTKPNTASYSRTVNIAYEFPGNPKAGLKQIKSKTIEGLNGWGESYTYTDNADVERSVVNGQVDEYTYYELTDNLEFHRQINGAKTSTLTYGNYKGRQPRSVQGALSYQESYDYDAFGNTTSKTLSGINTTYEYDDLDRLTKVKTADTNDHDISISYGVNDTGFIKTVTKGGSKLTQQYNQINRLVERTKVIAKPSGGTQTIKHTFSYDLLGRLIFSSYPNSTQGDSFEYDALDRTTKITHSDGTFIRYEYRAGNQVMITNEDGDKKLMTYQSYGDASEKYLVKIEYQPSSKSYQSDPMVTVINRHKNGLIDSVVQNGLTQDYGYDSNWNLDYITIPEVGRIEYTYDSRGYLTYKKVGDKWEKYILDDLFRTKDIQYSHNASNIHYEYDTRGRLDYVTKGRFKWDYSYDSVNNNMTQEVLTDTTSNRSFTFKYPHNAYGSIDKITYPNGETINLNPDSSGRPSQLGEYVTDITYNDNHTLNQVTFKNGITQSFDLDDRLFPNQFQVGSIYNKSYDFSGSGNLTNITDNINAINNKQMHYDQMSRLRRVDVSDGLSTQYDYDKNGNITQKFNNELMSFSFTYDNNNRLTSKRNKDGSVQSYQYDNSANVINDGKRGFTYGPDMHLASATSEHGVDFTYHYDPYGKRTLVQREGGFDKYYLYPSIGNIAYEWSQYDNIMHLYAADQRLVTKRVCNNQDQDGDGLEACIESDFNTSDHNKDSDGDGILDFAEVHQHETDPSKQDSDGDGLSDYQEIHQIKGDPRQKDTDRDGIIDSVEVAQGTSPDGSSGSPYKPDYLAAILVPIIHNILF